MEAASNEREMLEVYGNDYPTPDGTCLRDYIHVSDLADGHVKALNFLEENNESLIVNPGTGKRYSVLDVVKKPEEVCQRPIPYLIKERRTGDLAELCASARNTRLEIKIQRPCDAHPIDLELLSVI